MRRIRALTAVCALTGFAALAQGASAASSLTVALTPPIVGATPTVTFTMATDDPTVRFATGYVRVDDGRPCEGTLPAFEVASPGYLQLGAVPFAAGVTTRQAPRLTRPGAFRLCGYLTGANNTITLALDDRVISVRLPTGVAAVTLDPPVPVFSRPVAMRVSGSVDIPSIVDVNLTTGGCAEEAAVQSAPITFVDAGAFDVTIPDLALRQDVVHLCLAIRPQTQLAPPNDAHRLVSIEQPVNQDLGGSITGFAARQVGRAIEVSARVAGTFRIAPTIRLRRPDGVSIVGNICEAPSVREAPTDRLTSRDGNATGACLLDFDQARKLPAFDVSVFGQTTLGANIETPVISLDASTYKRTGRLVVPGESIGYVRLGMPLQELIDQGGRPDGFVTRHAATEKLILPGDRSRSLYGVDNVLAVVRGGRVRGIVTNWNIDFDPTAAPYRTVNGLTLMSAAGRAGLRRRAPGARCRRHPRNRALSDLCRIGPATYWGPRQRIGGQTGFFAIWPGARVRPPSAPLLP